MALKTLSSLVGDQPTRALELPNLDGVVHAAGTRGVIAMSPITGVWGFTPLHNKGRLNTYQNTTLDSFWIPGVGAPFDDTGPSSGTSASRIASNGDLIVVAYFDPDTWNSTATVNRDLYFFAFDAATGDLKSWLSATGSNLDYNTGNEVSEAELDLWEVKDGWFVAAVKHRSTSARYMLVACNYNTSTQTWGTASNGTNISTTSATSLQNCKVQYALSNDGTELAHTIVVTQFEACRWYLAAITGSAGAWVIGTSVAADQFSMDGAGILKCKMGGQSHVHRLSNDDIIMFGHAITGTGSNISYNTTGDFFINIWDSAAAAITQNYYLQNEVVANVNTSKFYFHHCLYSWEIATDTYIVLSKCSARGSAQPGPAGFWDNNDGYHHVRVTKVVIDPSDNSETQTDLGQFDGGLFRGVRFEDAQALDTRDQSSVYDWHIDLTDKYIMMITKMYTTRLSFNSDWTATDNANSRVVLAPKGPRLLDSEVPWINTSGSVNSADWTDFVQFDNRISAEHHFAYDHANKRLWCPMSLCWDSNAGQTPSTAACLTFDIEQTAGTALEVIVESADANNVKCIANFDCYDNNGVPVGSYIKNAFAITANQIISQSPRGTILDVLVSRVFVDSSGLSQLRFQPEDMLGGHDDVIIVNKGQLTEHWTIPNFSSDDNNMVFEHSQLDQVTGLQDASYEGPTWQWDDLDTELWCWFENGTTTVDYGSLLVVSEGWWVVGGQGATKMSDGSRRYKLCFALKPSSRVEMNGRFIGNSKMFMLKRRNIPDHYS